MRNRVTQRVGHEVDRIQQLRSRRSLADGSWIVDLRADELARVTARSTELIDRAVARGEQRVAEIRGRLRALSPLGTLQRGYAIVLGEDGTALRHVADAPAGTGLTVRVEDGAIAAVSEGAADAAADRAAEPVGARS
jgi:exodeoxyribonuclease VII large subunit